MIIRSVATSEGREITEQTEIREQNERESGRTSSGQFSLRAVSGIEVASVVISVLLTTWGMIPLQLEARWLIVLPGALALALIINSHRVRGESLDELGFTTRHFVRAWRLLFWPTIAAAAIFGTFGSLNHTFHRSSHFWTTLLFLPVWGCFQQYILQGFIYRRIRFLMGPDEKGRLNWAIPISASIFAFVHLPNPELTGLTLLGGLTWSWVYERAPNLWALGLSHALMSLLLMTTLPPWALDSMSVGYKYFLYQKF